MIIRQSAFKHFTLLQDPRPHVAARGPTEPCSRVPAAEIAMKKLAVTLALALGCALPSFAAPVSLLYIGSDPKSIRDFLDHSKQVDLAVPTWYHMDENGEVMGSPEKLVFDRCKADKTPVEPLIAMFDKKGIHKLASSATAEDHLIEGLLREAKAYGYIGFQFDIENIDYLDRDLLSGLVKKTADALHAKGLQLSIAVVPNAPGYAGETSFGKWIYTDWRGAFDLESIGKSVDLVCLMTYDQHTRWTTPGPVGGWQWTLDNIEYALKVVPAEKLSLGIPFYGYHWFTAGPKVDKDGKEQSEHGGNYIASPDAELLAQRFGGKIQWDEVDHTAYFWIYRDYMREWVYFTDPRTFQDRYDLIKKYKLQGFCSWVMGEEDQGIWKLLPTRK